MVDFFPIKIWYTKIHFKYILRVLTKSLSNPLLAHLIWLNIRWMLALFDLLCLYASASSPVSSRSQLCAAFH